MKSAVLAGNLGQTEAFICDVMHPVDATALCSNRDEKMQNAMNKVKVLNDKLSTVMKRSNTEKLYNIEFHISRIIDFIFEKTYRLDFSRPVHADELLTDNLINDNSKSAQHATYYLTSLPFILRRIIDEAHHTGFQFDNFIDIGSGKGRPCLYAAQTGRFYKVIGVEFSDKLVEIAQDNAEKCKLDKDITFVNMDAADYVFPSGKNLIYLFNPFNEHILEKLIKNNIAYFEREDAIIA
ncbi:MAG: class I SAM-dependent methyltransferase, partial [Clostridia bacterium]|nr:class I SAM-dependent methyltransferase [Clostridia bacterium]